MQSINAGKVICVEADFAALRNSMGTFEARFHGVKDNITKTSFGEVNVHLYLALLGGLASEYEWFEKWIKVNPFYTEITAIQSTVVTKTIENAVTQMEQFTKDASTIDRDRFHGTIVTAFQLFESSERFSFV